MLFALGERPGMSADVVAAQSSELLSVLEQLPEGVFVLDAQDKVIFANKPGLRLVKMKPKKALGEAFPYALEDGTMRDFDVEMMVKPMSWGGQDAKLVHLKPLKSAGAFHLEWKLESALEKARSAELMLEEWKSREGLPVVGEIDPELQRSFEETREQLSVAQARELDLSVKLDEYQAQLARKQQEFDDRMAELESLLEMAETRADDLEQSGLADDAQAANDLQEAVRLAQEAEDQLRGLEVELSEARDRLRVAEEQAEVAEERAYSLETELERLGNEIDERPTLEELELLRDELDGWRSRSEEFSLESTRLQAELAAKPTLDPAELEGKEAEIADLVDQLQARDDEIAILTDRVEVKEEELANALSQVASGETELAEQAGRAAAREQELAEQSARMEALQTELTELQEALQAREAELALEREQQGGQTAELAAQLALLTSQLSARESELLDLQAALKEKSDRLEAEADSAEAMSAQLESLKAELEVARQDGSGTAEALERAQAESEQSNTQVGQLEADLETLRQQLADAEDALRVRSEESDELAEQLRAETEQSEELTEQMRQENEALQESVRAAYEELESLRSAAREAEALLNEHQDLKAAYEEAAQQLATAQEAVSELESTRAELISSSGELERLQKEVQKLELQLDEVGGLAEKGERADKLERKLEGALRRAEEAEERLQEERRLLAELRQTSERRIAELENRGATGEADPETERMAFQDPLTGLPNSNILHRYLGFMLKQSVRYERYTALLRIDCDNFKAISDAFGPDAGDRMIRLVGERLSAVVRGSDVLGRLGEDEFVILLSELTDQKEASVVTASVIKRIYQMLKKPFMIDEQSVSVNVSIGVSLYPLDASNGEQMFQHSAVALKRAKDTGRGQAQYFTPEVQSNHEARMTLDHELKTGLERGEFGLLYQPIFDLSNGQIVGVEALIRWNHPRLGIIGPDEFLKVAEESGIIVLIGNWALRSALQRAAQWQANGLGLFVSLNLSRRQLLQADLIPTIHSALAEFRCSPDRILLEIPEELTGPELPRLRDTLTNLQQLGVRLAVDNFGTSASSLQELRRGPFQVLKIDRRYIRGVTTDDENKGIVVSALTLGHHLGRVTVAVGVETEEEKTWLAKTGCRFAQGNLLAGPLPPEHVAEIVTRR